MAIVRRSALRNPATWYLLLGFGVLSATVWVPVVTAERTARVETRADTIAGLLLEAGRGFPCGVTPADTPILLARFYALACRDQAFTADLELVDPPLPDTLVTLRNKHYLFHFAASAPDARATASPDTTSAYEVMAWPEDPLGPAHTVFFRADNAPRAYTRNLTAGYHGAGNHRPPPSRSHRRPAGIAEASRSYRDLADERWIVY